MRKLKHREGIVSLKFTQPVSHRQDWKQSILPLNPIYIPPQDMVIKADGTKIKFGGQ